MKSGKAGRGIFMEKNRKAGLSEFQQGMRDGAPIGAGYFAVSFSLGIAAHKAGMTPVEGFFLSLLNNASAGEYAGISAMLSGTSLTALAVLILVTNARYLLMSCALSQKLSPEVSMQHRFLIAWGVTDELFGIGVGRSGYVKPSYMYGAFLTSLSFWATGTACGVVAGNILPQGVVAALSASIFGMFLAVIIPPARKSRTVGAVVLGASVLSCVATIIPVIQDMSESIRVILLTLAIAITAAIVKPVEYSDAEEAAGKNTTEDRGNSGASEKKVREGSVA